MNIELLIKGAKGVFMPVVCGEIRLTSEKWSAGYLEFSVLKEGSIDFKEGDCVSLRVNDKNMFYGYVFTKKRTKRGIISVLCYDQMRYLKNRDTYSFSNLTAADIFRKLANDYNIKTGQIDPTGYCLPPRVEDNTELMDILYTAVALTEDMGCGSFIIYDDFGSLCLKSTKYMVSNLVVDKTTVIDFDYRTTIDKNVYNKIKLIYKRDTKNTHTLNVFGRQDNESIKKWGVLQYFKHIDINKTDGNAEAEELLKKYNVKNRQLNVLTLGNTNIRAGWSVKVQLDIGDFNVDEYMDIKKCCHIFKGNSHIMELTLEGGVLVE